MVLPKHYSEIIEDTILALNTSMGSSRQALWKAIHGAFPCVRYSHFFARLKKMRDAGMICQRKGKFRLEVSYKRKLLKALEKGKNRRKVASSSV